MITAQITETNVQHGDRPVDSWSTTQAGHATDVIGVDTVEITYDGEVIGTVFVPSSEESAPYDEAVNAAIMEHFGEQREFTWVD